MLIWGSKGKAKKIGTGYFFCPNCRIQTPYIHYQLGKYFTLYFIPIFQTENFEDYVECQKCSEKYKPSVLSNEYNQASLRIIEDLKLTLESGIPVQKLLADLNDSTNTELLKDHILIATGGKLIKCNQCNSVFSATINFCSVCGSKLDKNI